MAWTKPTLVTSIGQYSYWADLNLNFAAIDAANDLLAAELAAMTMDLSEIPNWAWISRQTGTSGVVGLDGFPPAFVAPWSSVSVAVPASGASDCVIDGQIHTLASAFSQSLAGMGGSPAKRCIIGAISDGAPSCHLVCEQADTGSGTADLLLWTFNLLYTGGVYTVSSLKREATVLWNRYTGAIAAQPEFPVPADYEGAIPVASGELAQAGIVMPWDGWLERAYIRFRTAPGAGTSTSINIRSGTTPLLASASFGSTDAGVVKTLAALASPVLLAEGTWIRPYSTVTGDPSAASDMDVVYVLKQAFHQVSFA